MQAPLNKILIIGPSWVGDMVMAQSLFKLLKHQNENVIIDVLAPAWTFSLLARMREVSNAIEAPFQHGKLNLSSRISLAKKIKNKNYDQAIILPNSFKSALIPWLAGIPIRTGWLGECRYFLLNDIRKLDKQKYPRMVDQFLALGLPKKKSFTHTDYLPSFSISTKAQEAILAKHKPLYRDRPILALCPGAEFGPAKRWPAEYFAQVANQKMKEGWDIWLFGSTKDKPIIDEVMNQTHHACENFVGRIDLAETIDLLSLTQGVISNDSGLMHVASALNKPVIAIYGSTSPTFTPPLSPKANILKLDLACQPCFNRICPLKHLQCLKDLTPEVVLSTMKQWNI